MLSEPPETGVITDAKKTSGSALITPSVAPVVLLKVRRRPLTKTTNCVGPTAPIESGGNAPVSASVAPVKLVPTVCGALLVGSSAADGAAPTTPRVRVVRVEGVLAKGCASGSC